MRSVKEILGQGKKQLQQYNIDISEARLLLAFVLGIEKTKLYSIEQCQEDIANRFFECIKLRCEGMPYAYIVGTQEFMKLPFKVNSNVLIPRADTEILVENVIATIKEINQKNIKVLDMCTGSGCIAISIDKYVDNIDVVGADISQEAIDIAKINNDINETEVEFIQSDLFQSLQNEKFNIIVSNPPYIKSSDISTLQLEVLKEPYIALDGGSDGLRMYTDIIAGAKEYLTDEGYLIFEIGFDQGKDVCDILSKEGYVDIKIIKDLSNNDRVIKCRFLKK